MLTLLMVPDSFCESGFLTINTLDWANDIHLARISLPMASRDMCRPSWIWLESSLSWLIVVASRTDWHDMYSVLRYKWSNSQKTDFSTCVLLATRLYAPRACSPRMQTIEGTSKAFCDPKLVTWISVHRSRVISWGPRIPEPYVSPHQIPPSNSTLCPTSHCITGNTDTQ